MEYQDYFAKDKGIRKKRICDGQPQNSMTFEQFIIYCLRFKGYTINVPDYNNNIFHLSKAAHGGYMSSKYVIFKGWEEDKEGWYIASVKSFKKPNIKADNVYVYNEIMQYGF